MFLEVRQAPQTTNKWAWTSGVSQQPKMANSVNRIPGDISFTLGLRALIICLISLLRITHTLAEFLHGAEAELMTVWYSVAAGFGHVASGNMMWSQLQACLGRQCHWGMLAKPISDCGMLVSKGWERVPVHQSHPRLRLHVPTDDKLLVSEGCPSDIWVSL